LVSEYGDWKTKSSAQASTPCPKDG